MKDQANKKYELTDDTIIVNGITLYRVRALKDFGNVKVGDLGGFIQSEDNLSHKGDCWIYNDAQVYGNARVYDDAKIYDLAKVYGNVEVYDNARVFADARVHSFPGAVRVCGNARVFEDIELAGAGAELVVGRHQDW